jgi:hypothetical protein
MENDFGKDKTWVPRFTWQFEVGNLGEEKVRRPEH